MQRMRCWRWNQEAPILDEDEYAVIAHLYTESMRATKEFRQLSGIP
jgi:hypothetical protein